MSLNFGKIEIIILGILFVFAIVLVRQEQIIQAFMYFVTRRSLQEKGLSILKFLKQILGASGDSYFARRCEYLRDLILKCSTGEKIELTKAEEEAIKYYPSDVVTDIGFKFFTSDEWRIHYNCPSCRERVWIGWPLNLLFGLPRCLSCLCDDYQLRDKSPMLLNYCAALACVVMIVLGLYIHSHPDDGLVRPSSMHLPVTTDAEYMML